MCFQMGKLGESHGTEAAPGKGKWHASFVMLKKKMVEGKVWDSKQEIGGKLAHRCSFLLIGSVLVSRRSGVTDRWARADTCFWGSLIFKCSSCVNTNTWGNQRAWREWRVVLLVPISLSVSACLFCACLVSDTLSCFQGWLKNHRITMKKQCEVIVCSIWLISPSLAPLCHFASFRCYVVWFTVFTSLCSFMLGLHPSLATFLNVLALRHKRTFSSIFLFLFCFWHALPFLNQNRLRRNEVIIFTVASSVSFCQMFCQLFSRFMEISEI